MRAARLILAAALGLACLSAHASETVSVSVQGYNRFTFAEPFEQVVLPPNAPLASQPVAMAGNTTLLIDLDPNADSAIQMVVQLASGKVVDFSLEPGASLPASWQELGGMRGDKAVQRPADNALIKTFQAVLADPHHPPPGFSEAQAPMSGHIKGMVADYIAMHVSADYQLLVLRLRAERRSPILPQDLFVPGVKAVYIEGDTVGPDLAPLAVVLKGK